MEFNTWFQPLHSWLLVEEIPQDNSTESGLVLIESEFRKSYTAKVLAVGPGYIFPRFIPESGKPGADKLRNKLIRASLDVKKGDIVQFPQHVAYFIKIDGKSLILVKEEDINGILE